MRPTLASYKKNANSTVNLLTPYCEKIAIVGSIARNLEFTSSSTQENVDLLIIPKAEIFPFISYQHYIKTLSDLKGVEFFPHTQWFALMTFIREGIKTRLYTATESDFGIAKLIFTGSNKFNLTLIDRAKSMGLVFNTDSQGIWGIWDKEGVLLTDGSEESVFRVLRIKYIRQENRSLFEKDPTILQEA